MKKLYTTLVFVSLLVTASRATIHYTEVHDDFYFATFNYDMDLDGDDDFRFNSSSATIVVGLKPTSYFSADANNAPKAYASGAGLGSYHWQIDTGQLNSFTGVAKYLMVKFNSGNYTYYGWFLVDLQSYPTVISYAYNDVPNAPITPGDQGASGVEEINPLRFALANLGRQQISFQNCAEFDQVKVYDVQGKLLI